MACRVQSAVCGLCQEPQVAFGEMAAKWGRRMVSGGAWQEAEGRRQKAEGQAHAHATRFR